MRERVANWRNGRYWYRSINRMSGMLGRMAIDTQTPLQPDRKYR